ncbi:MAG: hypothetical protein NT116_03125 [Candidatus Parcubacteria bacterium]|nr:hypothetical protein [Candidatus Parcubacteria bacterium]
MLEISLSIFLIIYGLAIIIFVIMALVNLFHLFAYGFLSFTSFLATFLFLAAAVLILFITYKFGLQIDWSQTFII